MLKNFQISKKVFKNFQISKNVLKNFSQRLRRREKPPFSNFCPPPLVDGHPPGGVSHLQIALENIAPKEESRKKSHR